MKPDLGTYSSAPDFIDGFTREVTAGRITTEYLVTDQLSIWKQVLAHTESRAGA